MSCFTCQETQFQTIWYCKSCNKKQCDDCCPKFHNSICDNCYEKKINKFYVIKNKFNIIKLTTTMIDFIDNLISKGVIVEGATPLDKFCYNGEYNKVIANKGDIIQLAFHILNDGTEFVYYNILNE